MTHSAENDAGDLDRLREVERTALLAAVREILDKADWHERTMGPNAVPVSTLRRLLEPWRTSVIPPERTDDEPE